MVEDVVKHLARRAEVLTAVGGLVAVVGLLLVGLTGEALIVAGVALAALGVDEATLRSTLRTLARGLNGDDDVDGGGG